MRVTDASGGCWPTPQQELLLKASLLKTDAAVAAWQEWYAQEGLDHLDSGSYRLLPLTHQNLHQLGFQDTILGKLRGVRRRAWCESHYVFRQMSPILGLFQQHGIPTMLLKGAALTLLHYRDFGLRPMRDLDILVPEECAIEAVSLLEAEGWSRKTLPAVKLTDYYFSYPHSAEFSRGPKENFDLHWHVLYQATFAGADKPFWDVSVPVDLEGYATRALCPTDQLLHACVHGIGWNNIPPMRWVADAWVVLESSQIDWARLIRIATDCRVILHLRDGFRYLVRTLNAEIPEEVLQELESAPVTREEELRYQTSQMPEVRTTKSALRSFYFRYRQTVMGKGLLDQTLGVPLFLQHYWNLDGPWRVLPTTLSRGMRRMGLARTAE